MLLAPFRIDSGPYAGAYRVTPTGAVNWYFATTALLRLRRLPLAQTREYLDAYLSHLDSAYGIADLLPQTSGIFAPIAPDSEDAYSATLLSLAVRYARDAHDVRWWQRHVATLQSIAYAKILIRFKPDGLVRASTTNPTGYLMDNVEDYAGLRAFAGYLAETNDPQAAYVAGFVAPLGDAIHRLYDERARAFRWSDSDPIGPMAAYPSCIAQLYPQFFAVGSSTRGVDISHFSAARKTLAACRFSSTEHPHEALLYALFLSRLPDRSQVEDERFNALQPARPPSDDLISLSLFDALRAK